MKQDNTFSKYIAKQKLKGTYTDKFNEQVQLDEGIGDTIGHVMRNTPILKNIKKIGNYDTENEITVYRVAGDLSDRNFRQYVLNHCTKMVKDPNNKSSEEGPRDVDAEQTNKGPIELNSKNLEEICVSEIKKIIKNLIDGLVTLANGNISDKDDKASYNLSKNNRKGYKYTHVQGSSIYMYFDTEMHAKTFLREEIREQKYLDIDEKAINTMFTIEKRGTTKSALYDKSEKEKELIYKQKTINHEEFDSNCAKEIYNSISNKLVSNAKDSRFGTDVTAYRVKWEWSDEEIEKFVETCGKNSLNDSESIKDAMYKQFKILQDFAVKSGNFLYAKGTKLGNVNIYFESKSAARNFTEKFDDEHFESDYKFFGNITDEIEECTINSKMVDSDHSKLFSAKVLLFKVINLAKEKEIITDDSEANAKKMREKDAVDKEKLANSKIAINIGLKLDQIAKQFVDENTFVAFNKEFDTIMLEAVKQTISDNVIAAVQTHIKSLSGKDSKVIRKFIATVKNYLTEIKNILENSRLFKEYSDKVDSIEYKDISDWKINEPIMSIIVKGISTGNSIDKVRADIENTIKSNSELDQILYNITWKPIENNDYTL